MVSLGLVAVLDQLRAGDCRIIAFGDWDQLEPVGNSWRGKSVHPLIFQGSRLLEQWAGSTHFKLTRCRRSDGPHFRFYTNLHENLSTAISWTRARYKKSDQADLHLVISHAKRRAINTRIQGLFAQGRLGVAVPRQAEPGYMCVAGTQLVGSCSGRGFVNGAFYQVQEVGETIKILDKLTAQVIETTVELLAKHTCLAWAVVYNRAQGLTIKDQTVCLHDFQSPYFRRPHLYVGLSRVTRGEDIRWA